MKKALALFATILLFSFTTFAQNTASADATVSTKITKGLAIANIGGSLDFGTILMTGSAQNPSITTQSGANFEVTGHPNKDVTVDFSSVDLDNNAWASPLSAPTGTITFTPTVEETGTSSTYSSPNIVTTGNTITLNNVNGTGTLYLWVGGALGIAANQPAGDYTGTFTVTVAY